MKTVSKIIFWVFIVLTVISLGASLIMCEDAEESKNARKTALWSMISGVVLTYVSWIMWSL